MKVFCFAALFSLEVLAECPPIEAFDCMPQEETAICVENHRGPPLKGIILLGPQASIHREMEGFEGISAESLTLPNGLFDFQRTFKSLFWGLPLTIDLVKQIQKQVILYYRDQGHPLVLVEIPAQDISSGVLQLRVQEGTLGDVVVCGNRWFGDDFLRRYVRICEGNPIDARILLDDIAWINRNPFREAEARFTPGRCEGMTDIELLTRDRFPLRTYVGGDNTGTRISDRARLWAGFDWGYAFMFDQIFSYQYTCAPHFKEYQAHNVHYTAPLPWRHILVIYGGISWTNPNIRDFHGEGKNAQGSLRYEIPLKPFFNHWLQEIEFGFDIKSTKNVVSFVGTSNASQDFQNPLVNISQLVLGYDIGWETENHKVSINALAFYSPGKILANQTDADFNNYRPGAKNQYLYGYLETSYSYTIGYDFSLFAMGRFQKASRPLIPSEQLAIGGYDTVRGYDELLFLGDNGVIANLELNSPELSLLRLCWDERIRIRDDFHFLLFFDLGYAELITPILDEPRRAFMMSAGPGIRYRVAANFSARVDYGFKCQTVSDLGDTSLGKLHLGMLLSF